ncbi:MAG TPA: hypothetical protein VGV92_05400 [Gammaproteobacteria bacterium]|nr:hypothetical protein [Gammaproteobacteria bacterium]
MQEPQSAQAVYEMLLNAIKTSRIDTVNNILNSLHNASVFSQDQWSLLIEVTYKQHCRFKGYNAKEIFCQVFSTLCLICHGINGHTFS